MTTPMNKPHRVVQVPAHTRRNGTRVKGHTRRVLLKPPYVAPKGVQPNSGQTPGYQNGGDPMSGMTW